MLYWPLLIKLEIELKQLWRNKKLMTFVVNSMN